MYNKYWFFDSNLLFLNPFLKIHLNQSLHKNVGLIFDGAKKSRINFFNEEGFFSYLYLLNNSKRTVVAKLYSYQKYRGQGIVLKRN